MNLETILQFCRAQCQTDSNGLTDANGIIFANEALFDFHRQLIMKGIDAAQVQEAYTNIIAGQGTYLFPTNMFFLKTVTCNFTDQTDNNYLPTQQIDISNLPAEQTFPWLRANQNIARPLIDVHGDWFEIFPTPTSGNTNGIGIFYFLGPTPFVNTTDTVAYPDSLDYRCIGWRICASYKKSLLDFGSAQFFDKEYQNHINQLMSTIERGSQQPMKANWLSDSGWQY